MGGGLLQPSTREFPGGLGSWAPLRHPGELRLDMADMRGARRIRGADPLVYPRAASRAADTCSGAVMNSVSTDAKTPPRWALWIVGVGGFGVYSLALLLWGLNGPTYIFDLIAAYCG